MKHFITLTLIVAAMIAGFGFINMNRSTTYNPLSKVEMQHLSYYGQYNSYNNSYRTNYVRPYVTRTGRYVGGYYRS